MEDILEAISNEICKKVREKIDIKTIFKAQKPQKASALIQEGINVLEKWHREFNQTKQEIENQSTIRRWEFTRMKEIFAKPKHMKYILEDLNTACIVLKEFYAILGKDLKAVTGSSDQIEQVLDRVKEQVRKLENFPHDVFNQAYYDEWKATFSGFDTAIINIEQETVQLISHTFNKKLNSSEGAFNLLAKFKNVQTRPKILAEFSNKYDNVLGRYNDELKEMEDLYKTLKVNPPIPKNMPPDSGSIAWSRSIITRIKTPIDKFKQKPEILSKNQPGI